MYKELNISDKVINLANEVEKELEPIFKKLEENCMKSSAKVLKAFQNNNVWIHRHRQRKIRKNICRDF